WWNPFVIWPPNVFWCVIWMSYDPVIVFTIIFIALVIIITFVLYVVGRGYKDARKTRKRKRILKKEGGDENHGDEDEEVKKDNPRKKRKKTHNDDPE
ncbi:unnamed protein product, partial [marine sediment metagenome]